MGGMWRKIIADIGALKVAREIGLRYQTVWYYTKGRGMPRRKNLAGLKDIVLKYAPDKYQQFEISLNKDLTGM